MTKVADKNQHTEQHKIRRTPRRNRQSENTAIPRFSLSHS